MVEEWLYLRQRLSGIINFINDEDSLSEETAVADFASKLTTDTRD
jgi:hypothetical protein